MTPPATIEPPETDHRADAHNASEGPPRLKRVLMLTHRLPYPPDRGDRIRSYHMLKLLSKHFDVGLACTTDEPVWLQHHQLLRTIATRVAIQPISTTFSKAKGVAALMTGRAVTRSYHFRVGLAEAILQWQEQEPFDAVLTFCSSMIQYARLLVPGPDGRLSTRFGTPLSPERAKHRTKTPHHVLDLVDVDSVKWANYAAHSWPPMRWIYGTEARRLRRIEAGRFDNFDAVTVVSAAEAQAYRDHVGEHPGLAAVSNGVDLEYFSPLPEGQPNTIVFVGVLNYRPNADGLVWFVKEVLGLLRERVPDVKFLIVGRHPTPRVRELGDEPGVEVIGSVPDVRTYLEQATAVIAPLRIARGVQNKVLEAMACQRAVVCSPGAAEGIEGVDNEHLLVADHPGQWVEQLERLLADAELRDRIATAARHHVETHYSWEQSLMPMVSLLNGEPPPSP